MKCTPPPANQLALECQCGTELCYVIMIIFFFNAALQRGSYHPVSRTLVT